ncbi:MAG TPA: hypothetical protein VLA89_02855 [Gemmatimonadales bacterium]|nr:hypothetical protein [Gemmatimonadales bacterium]
MSTRSRIGIIREKPEGKAPVVESIYCHFDGYPEGVGKTLLESWTTEEKVNELMRLGDLSVLGSELGEDQGTDWFDKRHAELYGEDVYPNPGNDPRLNWCVAYGRDRGEDGCASRIHMLDDWPDYGQEAEYIFDPADSTWRVSSPAQNPVGWNTVAPWEGFVSIPEAIELEQAATSQA